MAVANTSSPRTGDLRNMAGKPTRMAIAIIKLLSAKAMAATKWAAWI